MTNATLTTAKAGKLLGVCAQTVRNMIAAGMIRATYTPGGHCRINLEAINDFLRKNHCPTFDEQ